MGLTERSKKKVQLYKKAIVHFLLCFVMGFFTGFAPTGKPSFFSSLSLTRSAFSPQPIEIVSGSSNRTLLDETPVAEPTSRSTNNSDDANSEKIQEEYKEVDELVTRRLIIVVTPTSMKDQTRGVNLRRLSNTLRLVPPPLLWVVVEQQCESDEVSEILRKTGIMYRHVVFKENFTDVEVEMDHQRNLALNHIEHHRLSGIVHFAGLSNVYDLSFFDEIRGIEVFGTWPMALVSANRNRVIIEGPVCDSSEVVGWHLRKMNNLTEAKSPVHISSFAFNSSILWDPERWGRPSSVQDTTQNTIKFVKNEVLEEETQLIGIPAEGCSKIMLWDVHIPTGTTTNTRLHVTSPDSSKR
ncbi:putative beta-1,4-xylosyltransferase IRX9 [Camellia lanceoleosa]|uniref:Beta-1,4-xylosyltransferase IRX9 n=1 Tax=Camellia lanceoleosa TaxID=1840588 RepID=A0ACC0HID5_9ERIC|nr:putative beta-1,4-xylosyltransferase IRX9 [Camellia lanceoleosa]